MRLFCPLDAYIRLAGSFCLRYIDNIYEEERPFDISNAKEECSKNPRCVGIEYVGDKQSYFMCLDSIYTSTAFDKYNDPYRYLYRKLENHGKYIHQVLKF